MSPQTYPVTRTSDDVDKYHGFWISDAYRWLERSSEERASWISAQNTLTREYLSRIPIRAELRRRFDQLLGYERYYDLVRRGPFLFFKKNSGLQNQLVLCVQRGLKGRPRTLVDPIALRPDGTLRVTVIAPSSDGRYLAYGLSSRGTDWEEYFVVDVRTGKHLPDTVRWAKASNIAWHGDGFYYSRYPEPTDVTTALTARNEAHQVWYHRVRTPQSADVLVYSDCEHPLRHYVVQAVGDDPVVILTEYDLGAGHAGNALWRLDPTVHGWIRTPIVSSFEDTHSLVDALHDNLLVLTHRGAPNGRLVLIDPVRTDESQWRVVIPEREHALEAVTAVGGKLFATYRTHGSHKLYVFDRAGRCEDEVTLPGVGVVRVFPGQPEDLEAIWNFSSFATPPTVYRYDIASCRSAALWQPRVQFDVSAYETTQVFYRSRDGTRIPMFVVHRRGLELNRQSTLLLQGYGGNGFSLGPSFDPLLIALLERGVVFAVAGLRGGGEYGESWHRAGWREKKQAVFDDCIAAAEWLQANGYTSRTRCGLIGTSNGGLMVAAVVSQRPELFAVALPGAGIMDMLRFQHFTSGWAWIAEYGSADDPNMFRALLAYSPLHNIRDGMRYPATLVTTYEQDDRVVPAHSFKFIATLQRRARGPGPYLIRIESDSGHGAVNLHKELEERADIYAFLLENLSERPPDIG